MNSMLLEKDTETDLTYPPLLKSSGRAGFGSRYYTDLIGRFTSQDPVILSLGSPELEQITERSVPEFLSDPQLLNSYSYVRNNPIKMVDEEGETPELFLDVGMTVFSVGGIMKNASESLWSGIGILFGRTTGNEGLAINSQADLSRNLGELRGSTLDFGFDAGAMVIPFMSAGIRHVGKSSDEVLQAYNSTRSKLLGAVENSKLRNHISNLYKKHSSSDDIIGNGSAIDALRYELRTLKQVGSKWHKEKIENTLSGLNKLLKNQNLSTGDRQITESLVNRINDVLKGGGLK